MPQRTPLQAYQRVLRALEAGKVNPAMMDQHCSYEEKIDGKVLNCGVGCLFNRSQLKDINARGLNTQIIRAVSEVIGETNLVEVTGLDIDMLEGLQEAHDGGNNKEFRKYLERHIKKLTKA